MLGPLAMVHVQRRGQVVEEQGHQHSDHLLGRIGRCPYHWSRTDGPFRTKAYPTKKSRILVHIELRYSTRSSNAMVGRLLRYAFTVSTELYNNNIAFLSHLPYEMSRGGDAAPICWVRCGCSSLALPRHAPHTPVRPASTSPITELK